METNETRACHIDGTVVGKRDFCPVCVERHKTRTLATAMSAEARAAELEQLIGVLEMPFGMLHERIEELVKRPVWTHELAHPEQLVAEIRSRATASFADVLDKLPADKAVIVTPYST